MTNIEWTQNNKNTGAFSLAKAMKCYPDPASLTEPLDA
jgi:hypothetical protein